METTNKKRKAKAYIAIGLMIVLLSGTLSGNISVAYELCKVEEGDLSEYPDLYETATDYEVINKRMYEATDNKSYFEYAEAMINSGDYTISSSDFIYYFLWEYSLVQANEEILITVENGTKRITNSSETLEARETVIDLVIEEIGLENVENPYEAVLSAAIRIRSAVSYNKEYMRATMEEALEDDSAICVHYAQMMTIILNAEGIPCRMVYGTKNNLLTGETCYHIWNEVWIDGTWYTVDACIEATGFVYIPIGYKEIEL